MSKLENNYKQFQSLVESVPEHIRKQIHSYINQYELEKEYEDLTIDEFKDKLERNYINLSNKSLKYKVFNLMGMVDSNGCFIYNHNSFKKYISYKNPMDGLTPTNTIIEDWTGEYLFNIDKSQSAKNFAKVKYLEHYNKNQLKVFITFTNPSEYHFYKDCGTNKNDKCKFDTLEETVEESIKLQIEINRYFYNQLKKYLNRCFLNDNVDFIRQFENHKNMSVHSHSLYFIDRNAYSVIEHIYNQVINKFNLKMCDIEIIESVSASSYVSKYIIKSMNNENQNNNFHNHYKRFYSKYRFFTSSNYKNTNQQELNKTYSYLKKKNPKLIDRFKKSHIPLYVLLEKYIKRNLRFEYTTIETKTLDMNAIYKFIDEDKQIYTMLQDFLGSFVVYCHGIYKHILKNLNEFKTKIVKTKKIKSLICKHSNEVLKTYEVPIVEKLSINDLLEWYRG